MAALAGYALNDVAHLAISYDCYFHCSKVGINQSRLLPKKRSR